MKKNQQIIQLVVADMTFTKVTKPQFDTNRFNNTSTLGLSLVQTVFPGFSRGIMFPIVGRYSSARIFRVLLLLKTVTALGAAEIGRYEDMYDDYIQPGMNLQPYANDQRQSHNYGRLPPVSDLYRVPQYKPDRMRYGEEEDSPGEGDGPAGWQDQHPRYPNNYDIQPTPSSCRPVTTSNCPSSATSTCRDITKVKTKIKTTCRSVCSNCAIVSGSVAREFLSKLADVNANCNNKLASAQTAVNAAACVTQLADAGESVSSGLRLACNDQLSSDTTDCNTKIARASDLAVASCSNQLTDAAIVCINQLDQASSAAGAICSGLLLAATTDCNNQLSKANESASTSCGDRLFAANADCDSQLATASDSARTSCNNQLSTATANCNNQLSDVRGDASSTCSNQLIAATTVCTNQLSDASGSASTSCTNQLSDVSISCSNAKNSISTSVSSSISNSVVSTKCRSIYSTVVSSCSSLDSVASQSCSTSSSNATASCSSYSSSYSSNGDARCLSYGSSYSTDAIASCSGYSYTSSSDAAASCQSYSANSVASCASYISSYSTNAAARCASYSSSASSACSGICTPTSAACTARTATITTTRVQTVCIKGTVANYIGTVSPQPSVSSSTGIYGCSSPARIDTTFADMSTGTVAGGCPVTVRISTVTRTCTVDYTVKLFSQASPDSTGSVQYNPQLSTWSTSVTAATMCTVA